MNITFYSGEQHLFERAFGTDMVSDRVVESLQGQIEAMGGGVTMIEFVDDYGAKVMCAHINGVKTWSLESTAQDLFCEGTVATFYGSAPEIAFNIMQMHLFLDFAHDEWFGEDPALVYPAEDYTD